MENLRAAIKRFKTVKDFADWLWKMLTMLYQGDHSTEESIDFWLLNNKTESPSGTLAYLYKNYTAKDKQPMFRRAIVELLRRHGGRTNVPVKIADEIFEDLVYFIARIKEAEFLGELAIAVKKRLAVKKKPDILYSVLSLLEHFAPRREAYEAMSLLIDCEGFDEGYLWAAIKILVECEPQRTEALIAKLKPRILRRYQHILKGSKKQTADFWETIDGVFPEAYEVYARAKSLIRDCCEEA